MKSFTVLMAVALGLMVALAPAAGNAASDSYIAGTVSASGDSESLQGQVVEINGKIGVVFRRVSALEKRTKKTVSEVAKAKKDLAAANVRVASVDSRVDGLAGWVDRVEGAVKGMESNVTQNTSDIKMLGQGLADEAKLRKALREDISSLKSRTIWIFIWCLLVSVVSILLTLGVLPAKGQEVDEEFRDAA